MVAAELADEAWLEASEEREDALLDASDTTEGAREEASDPMEEAAEVASLAPDENAGGDIGGLGSGSAGGGFKGTLVAMDAAEEMDDSTWAWRTLVPLPV